MQILINPTVNEVYSSSFTSVNNNNITLTCNGLQLGEFVKVQIYDPITRKYFDWICDGEAVYMNSKNNVIEVFISQGTFRVYKSETSSPIGVVLYNAGVN